MILDSNILILAARDEHAGLRRLFVDGTASVSAISVVEVLGYHKLTDANRSLLEAFFIALEILPVSDAVIQGAVVLRQTKNRSLGDAIIAATALLHGRELKTHNLRDFLDVPGLIATEPLAAN